MAVSAKPELQRFGYVIWADAFVPREVGDGARHPAYAVEAPRAQAEPTARDFEWYLRTV